jgi:hypothetical protein
MKLILQTTALALLVMLGSSWRQPATAQSDYYDDYDDDISYQEFYDELSPHGRWIDYPEYGYVWVPSGIPGFRPYETGGHWVWTDQYEWMWVSDYSWGWAPFHYGRWFHDPFYGWMWVPGYEWAPAWVAWRHGGDYYGWAPLRPGFHIGINISIGSYNPPMDYWVFAPRRYISSPRIYNHCFDRSRNITIINNTTIINNYSRRNNVFINGPRRMDAERYAGRITPVRFRESSRPGRTFYRNNEVSVYRPRVRQSNDRQYTPRSFDRYDRNNNDAGRVRNNNTDVTRRNGNNLPGRRDETNRFERRNNNEVRQQNNNAGDRRPQPRAYERRNDERRGYNNEDAQRRREIFSRPDNNSQPRADDRRVRRSPEQRNNEVRQQQGNERPQQRNVFERRNNASRPDREVRSNNRFERQPSQEMRRQQTEQPRQFRSRNDGGGNNNREQRGDRNNGRERRNSDRRG